VTIPIQNNIEDINDAKRDEEQNKSFDKYAII
jgi:hypothetical protein